MSKTVLSDKFPFKIGEKFSHNHWPKSYTKIYIIFVDYFYHVLTILKGKGLFFEKFHKLTDRNSFEKVKLFYSRSPEKGSKNLEFVMVKF